MMLILSSLHSFWNSEYERFFSPETGIDIDGAWIDMNEPSSVRFPSALDDAQMALTISNLVLHISLH